MDAAMAFVLDIHNQPNLPSLPSNPLEFPSISSPYLSYDPSLLRYETAPTGARILWLQGISGRGGLGKKGSLIEQLTKARFSYNEAAHRVRLKPIPVSQSDIVPVHYVPPVGVVDPNADNAFMSLSSVYYRIVAFGGVGVALRMRITCKKFQMEFGPEDAGTLGLDNYEEGLKTSGSKVALAEKAVASHIEAARVSGKLERDRTWEDTVTAINPPKPERAAREMREWLGYKRPLFALIALLGAATTLLDKSFSRGMKREYFRRSIFFMIAEIYTEDKRFAKKFGEFLMQSKEILSKTKPKHVLNNGKIWETIVASDCFKLRNDTSKVKISKLATTNSTRQDRLDLDFAHIILRIVNDHMMSALKNVGQVAVALVKFLLEIIAAVRTADTRAAQTGVNVQVLQLSSTSAETLLRESDLIRRFLALHPPTQDVLKSGKDPLQPERDDLSKFRKKMERRKGKRREEEERKKRLYSAT